MNTLSRVFALIPAAGKSVRMGAPKLALPIGDRTMLEHVIGVLQQTPVSEILVVLGPHVASLAPLVEDAGAHALVLTDQTPDMRASVERGLDWLEQHCHPAPQDAFLLLPADHPALDADVVRRLLQARAEDRAATVCLPTCQGRRGHPVLIGWNHVPAIRALAPDRALNQYIRQLAAEVREVPVDRPEILRDVDTPEDYREMVSGEW